MRGRVSIARLHQHVGIRQSYSGRGAFRRRRVISARSSSSAASAVASVKSTSGLPMQNVNCLNGAADFAPAGRKPCLTASLSTCLKDLPRSRIACLIISSTSASTFIRHFEGCLRHRKQDAMNLAPIFACNVSRRCQPLVGETDTPRRCCARSWCLAEVVSSIP